MTFLYDLWNDLPEVRESPDSGLIASTVARATRFAPCIVADDFPYSAAARAVLVEVIKRRVTRGKNQIVPGVAVTKARGDRSVSVDGKGVSAALFQPDEIAELQAMCADVNGMAGAVTVPVYSFPDPKPWPC